LEGADDSQIGGQPIVLAFTVGRNCATNLTPLGQNIDLSIACLCSQGESHRSDRTGNITVWVNAIRTEQQDARGWSCIKLQIVRDGNIGDDLNTSEPGLLDLS